MLGREAPLGRRKGALNEAVTNSAKSDRPVRFLAGPVSAPQPTDRALAELEPVLTDYFREEYRFDELSLLAIELSADEVSGRWDALQYGSRNTDSTAFHLTIVNATTMIAQLAVAHGLTRLGRTRHNTTLLQVDFNVRCRFAIRKMRGLEASLRLESWAPKTTRKYPGVPGTLARWSYQIEHGGFVGETAILFLEKPGLTATFDPRS